MREGQKCLCYQKTFFLVYGNILEDDIYSDNIHMQEMMKIFMNGVIDFCQFLQEISIFPSLPVGLGSRMGDF